MIVAQHMWSSRSGWTQTAGQSCPQAQAVVYFCAPSARQNAAPYESLRQMYPQAHIIGCSTGGEILGDDVLDDSVSAVALQFQSCTVQAAITPIDDARHSLQAARRLADGMPGQGLRYVLLLADGMLTNGSALIDGLRDAWPPSVVISGGLAGDGADFRITHVGCDGPPQSGHIAALGFYGDALQVRCGSFGGWRPFGPERQITHAQGNVLYSLDQEPALQLYKRYLGEDAAGLPGSGLLFPLSIRRPDSDEPAVVRTIIAVDEAQQSVTFCADIPQGYVAQLMRGNFDDLVDGAQQAAQKAQQDGPSVSFLISCIGRKLLMGQRIVDEVEAAADALGPHSILTGFYSYGEISPHGVQETCELHNQTMTITTVSEG